MKRLIAMALCLAMLWGCAVEDVPHVPTGDGLTWEEGDSRPDSDTTAPPATEQELKLVYYPDRSMNPLLSTDFTNRTLFSLIYQGLFSVNRDYEAEPQLCGSYAMSEDMRTHVFYLADATFSDGSRLTANDVLQSLRAAMGSPYYSGRFMHISSVNATTDGAIVIETDAACEDLPILLDMPIVKASELEAERPLGTGPYFLESVTGGLRLRRRRDWWSNAQMVVTASSILLKEAVSETQIRDEFEFDDVGLVCANPCSDSYADFRCDYELWDSENGIFLYLGVNMYSDVFKNEELRRTLTYAIDRDKLVNDYYRDFARSATLPASPQSPYYDRGLASRYEYDAVRFAQVVSNNSLLGTDSYADFRCDYELWDSENGIFLYLGVNMYSDVFKNEELRRTLTYAIDRDKLVNDYYRDFARSATLPASPQSPYYDRGLASRYEYDAVRFAQVVSNNSLLGTSVRLLVNSDDSLRLRVARAIARMLTDCGLTVELIEAKGNNYRYILNVTLEYDLHLGQTKLSPNMDLTPFFSPGATLDKGGMRDAAIYALCLESLANRGNYYNLHQKIMEDGRLVPILFQSYAVYATRGLLTGLTPARDDVFYYATGTTVEDIRIEMPDYSLAPEEPTEPDAEKK